MTDSKCDCGLDPDPPRGPGWWQPTVDDEPGHHVRAVVRLGEEPEMRRAVRLPGGGWIELGHMVNFYIDITPPMSWERTGTCWKGTSHPVVECDPEPVPPEYANGTKRPGQQR